MICTACKRENDEGSKFCNDCGHSFEQPTTALPGNRRKLVVGLLAAVLVVGGAMIWNSRAKVDNDERSPQSTTTSASQPANSKVFSKGATPVERLQNIRTFALGFVQNVNNKQYEALPDYFAKAFYEGKVSKDLSRIVGPGNKPFWSIQENTWIVFPDHPTRADVVSRLKDNTVNAKYPLSIWNVDVRADGKEAIVYAAYYNSNEIGHNYLYLHIVQEKGNWKVGRIGKIYNVRTDYKYSELPSDLYTIGQEFADLYNKQDFAMVEKKFGIRYALDSGPNARFNMNDVLKLPQVGLMQAFNARKEIKDFKQVNLYTIGNEPLFALRASQYTLLIAEGGTVRGLRPSYADFP